jgi:hypothetical protein
MYLPENIQPLIACRSDVALDALAGLRLIHCGRTQRAGVH